MPQLKNVVYQIPLTEIEEAFVVRHYYDESLMEELAASVRKQGILQPVMLRSRGKTGSGKYKLVFGSRRLRAAKKTGASTVPALIIEQLTDRDAFVFAMTENMQRADLTIEEEARVCMMLMGEYKMSIATIAQSVGKSEATIHRRLQFLSLAKEVQVMVISGQLGFNHAIQLTIFKDRETQIRLAKHAAQNGLSEAMLRLVVAQEKGGKGEGTRWTTKPGTPPPTPAPTPKPLPAPIPSKAPTTQTKQKRRKSFGEYTAEYIQLKCRLFAEFIVGVLPYVLKMKGVDVKNTKHAFRELLSTLQLAVEKIEHDHGKF
ncbi:MAG TPA: ParB/RepB/Spo0J family partition protein [Patescibacteria group bacterium]|nr:ParB/RepB/Spo0J family partition protein [Patescibacteria group bacterium]